MVLNYRPANYIGWPIPALIITLDYTTKIQKLSELCNFFGNYFTENQRSKC